MSTAREREAASNAETTAQLNTPARAIVAGQVRADYETTERPAIFPTDSLWVRAIKQGYYGLCRRRVGDVFELKPYEITVVDPTTRKPVLDSHFKPQLRILTIEEQFSGNWMEVVGDDDEERELITGSQAAIDQANREIRTGTHPSTPRRSRRE